MSRFEDKWSFFQKSEYTKVLDDAVKEIKQNEDRRLEYMSINANSSENKEAEV